MGKSNSAYNGYKKPQTASGNVNVSRKTGVKSEKSKHGDTLDKLFEKNLKDIYSAEKQLIKALPDLVKAAENEDLQDAFNKHLEQTRRQAERLEKIFDRLEIDKSDEVTCKAMEGLIKETQETIKEFDKSPVRDSALIIGAQKVEHYEIAAYGSLRELAEVLRYSKIADTLDRTLQEEAETDDELSYIALDVNDEACEVSFRKETEMV
jgi:ferritin-like metal-binding protein YciE